MIQKLQIKFVVINMTMVTIMLVVMFGMIYYFTQRNLETESISMMKTIAANPFQTGRLDDASDDVHLPYFTLQLGIRGEIAAVGGGYYDLSDREFLHELIEEVMHKRTESGVIETQKLRYCRVQLPMGTVLVFSDMSSEKNTLKNLLQSFAVIGIFGFLVFLGISIFLSKWAVRPVARAWQQQRQFVADASHELKTPLTVILTNTELLQYPAYDEVQQTKLLQSIALMSRQMQQLVEKMLVLARSDSQQVKPSMSSFNFSDLVLAEVISFEGVFAEKGLILESEIASEITVCGNEDSLRQLLDILLDNAQKYSRTGAKACVHLYQKDRHRCCLKVSNEGEPIPQEEIGHIFQRFYRVDKARSRDGSFGLGLSIAQNIVQQHKGKIWAESREGVNSFFVVI